MIALTLSGCLSQNKVKKSDSPPKIALIATWEEWNVTDMAGHPVAAEKNVRFADLQEGLELFSRFFIVTSNAREAFLIIKDTKITTNNADGEKYIVKGMLHFYSPERKLNSPPTKNIVLSKNNNVAKICINDENYSGEITAQLLLLKSSQQWELINIPSGKQNEESTLIPED
jgi:hypothetical protein